MSDLSIPGGDTTLDEAAPVVTDELLDSAWEAFWAVRNPSSNRHERGKVSLRAALEDFAGHLAARHAADLAAQRERIARSIEVAAGERCPECGGSPASLKWKHGSYVRLGRCGAGHTWEHKSGDYRNPADLARSATPTPDATSRQDRLQEIRALQPGWLDGRGLVAAPEALDAMDALIQAYGLDGVRIYPTESGGLSLEWEDGATGRELVIRGVDDGSATPTPAGGETGGTYWDGYEHALAHLIAYRSGRAGGRPAESAEDQAFLDTAAEILDGAIDVLRHVLRERWIDAVPPAQQLRDLLGEGSPFTAMLAGGEAEARLVDADSVVLALLDLPGLGALRASARVGDVRVEGHYVGSGIKRLPEQNGTLLTLNIALMDEETAALAPPAGEPARAGTVIAEALDRALSDLQALSTRTASAHRRKGHADAVEIIASALQAARPEAAVEPAPAEGGQAASWCPEDVWDGPYKMRCGRMLRADGRCGTHGQVAAPAPTSGVES